MSDVEQAAVNLMTAITDPGPRPDIHHEVMRRHRAEWPTLWARLDELARALAEVEQ